ncbi:MAG TPA: ABC transporter ATP-binding protein [Bacteroidia bacterium]|nr:ABC transporter ATP-binding protein [Bacteroidia bacterium]
MSGISGSFYDFSILRKLFGFVKPYRRGFYSAIILTVLLSVLAPVRPWLTQIMLDDYIIAGNLQGVLLMAVIMAVILILQSLIQFYQTYITSQLGQFVVKDMRIRLFGKIISFGLPYFDRTPVGTPVTRTVSDMETVSDIFSDGLIVIIGDILQLMAIIGYMFWLDWHLTLISLSTLPLLLIATNVFKNGIKKTFGDVRTEVAALNVFVQEHLTGMRIVKLFNREEQEMEKFRIINKRHADANIRSVWYYSIFFPVVELLSAISVGLIVWYAAGASLEGTSSFGHVVAFIMYINLLFRPIRELADKFNTLQMGMVSSERIFSVLEAPVEEKNTGTRDASRITGHFEFRNVWFAYKDEDWVLRDVSFKVDAGEMLAIVGPTGAGKSSIINLINRFYDVSKGQILIDGVDVEEYELSSLRSRIAMVLQDVFLFSDTIANNISLSNPDISVEKMEISAKTIGADGFIGRLPGGLNYRVGERGGLLSVGQRQLLSFLRAQIFNPSILILDEATSSIDSESERLIIRATQVLTQNRTSVVIAHRLSTIRNAKNIMVLDKGKIVEFGPHQKLLQNDGLYRKLYESQFTDYNDVALPE